MKQTGELSWFPMTLFLIFMILKLCDVIDWSWWIVTLPLWLMPLAMFILIFLVAMFDGFKKS